VFSLNIVDEQAGWRMYMYQICSRSRFIKGRADSQLTQCLFRMEETTVAEGRGKRRMRF